MATKPVYQCDADGVYMGEAKAFQSPREPGVFPIPAGCVEVQPPELAAKQAAVWSGAEWTIVADYRGETWYDGATALIINFVGDPAERGYSSTAPEPTLEDIRSAKIAAITEAADALLKVGAPVDGGLHVSLDDGSRADLTAMAATATAASAGSVPWPESYSRGWITIENTRIALATPAAGLVLAAAAGDYYAAIVQHRRDLKDAALAAKDAPAVDAIDVTAGWPE